MGTEATQLPRQLREKINHGGERAAQGTTARENGKVRVEGTATRESSGVGSGGVGNGGEAGRGRPAAKGRAADLRRARLGEKGEVCFCDLMGGERSGTSSIPFSCHIFNPLFSFGDIKKYTVDPRSRP